MKLFKPDKSVAYAFTVIACTLAQVQSVNAEDLTQQFEASLTVVPAEATCSVSAPSIGFGNVLQGEAIDDTNNYATEFDLEFDCSTDITGVLVTFARESGDASGFWRMQSPPGNPANSIDYRIRKLDGTPITPRIPIPTDLNAGISSEQYVAWIDSIDNAGVTGDYISTVTVTIEF